MTKKYFAFFFRLLFSISAFQFAVDAVSRWEVYSHYMRFADLLPDLSLSYIFWSLLGIILTLFLWSLLVLSYRTVLKHLSFVSIEDLMIWITLVSFLAAIKLSYFSGVSLREVTGMGYLPVIASVFILTVLPVAVFRKYSGKLLSAVDSGLSPVFWLFLVLLIAALPYSSYHMYGNLKKSSSDPVVVSSGGESSAESMERPNIILVVWDSLTSRNMQLYGYERPTTPFISEWARDAVVFDNFYAASNASTPSTMSMMTGQRVWTHRVWHDAYYYPAKELDHSLPKMLSEAGYENVAFVSNGFGSPKTLGLGSDFIIKEPSHSFWVESEWWFNRFEKYLRAIGSPIAKKIIFSNPLIGFVERFRPPVPTTSTLVPPEKVYNGLLDYLDTREEGSGNQKKRPFFAFIFAYPPHYPYLPPEPFMGMYGDPDKFTRESEQSWLLYGDYEPEDQWKIDILEKRYDEFITYSDHEFERFILKLSKVADMSNTIILFTGDHGQSFSHGYKAHGYHMYEPIVRVPLVVRMPGGMGKRISTPVGQLSIAPTILDMAGIRTPDWMEGRSLTPLMEGGSFEDRPVFTMDFIENRYFGHPITKGVVSVRDGDHKLIYYLDDEKTLLFDLEADPDETTNISGSEIVVRDRLLNLIKDNLDQANEKITRPRENS